MQAKKSATAKKTFSELPPALTKKSKLEKLVVDGYEKLVSRASRRRKELKHLEEEQAKDEAELIKIAKELRLNAEKAGQFFKTVLFNSDGKVEPLSVIFADKYSEISTKHEPLLRELLKDLYKDTFERVLKIKPKKHMSIEDLRERLGARSFNIVAELFELNEVLCPKNPFMEIRANLRSTTDEALNENIDNLIEHIQAKPSIK